MWAPSPSPYPPYPSGPGYNGSGYTPSGSSGPGPSPGWIGPMGPGSGYPNGNPSPGNVYPSPGPNGPYSGPNGPGYPGPNGPYGPGYPDPNGPGYPGSYSPGNGMGGWYPDPSRITPWWEMPGHYGHGLFDMLTVRPSPPAAAPALAVFPNCCIRSGREWLR